MNLLYDEMIAVLQAAEAGKIIQCRRKHGGTWDEGFIRSNSRVGFNFIDYDYRVKPEPREWWIHKNEITGYCSGAYPCPQLYIRPNEIEIHVREVLDE
jgi:hypothetical protein